MAGVGMNDDFSFLVLNKQTAWERGRAAGVETSDRGLTLAKTHEYVPQATTAALGESAVDFAVGQCNLLYILDAGARAVLVYDPGQDRTERIDLFAAWLSVPTGVAFAPASPGPPAAGATLYIADRLAGQRLTALAELNWQIRWAVGASRDATGASLGLPAAFAPIDVAVGPDRSLYALDGGNRSILRFNPAGRLTTVFGAADLASSDPTALAIAPDGPVYVLDLGGPRVLRFAAGGQAGEKWIDFGQLIAEGVLPAGFVPAGLAVDQAGDLYVGDGRLATSLSPGDDDDRFLRRFDAQGRYVAAISAYRGSVRALAVDAADRVYVCGREDLKLTILARVETYLWPGAISPPSGDYFSPALDSTLAGPRWHRLVLDADIPPNTQVWVSCLTGDDLSRLDQVVALPGATWTKPLVNPTDALIRCAAGRYLWLKVRLIGNETATPVVRSIRAYFPRLSYLRYLPSAYQEDAASRDFLERFLSLFESFFAGLEGQIDHIVRYFDAAAISGDFLRWLASWLAIGVDQSWTEEKLRALLMAAPQLYKQRGTRAGMEAMIELFTGARPWIVEKFQLRCAQEPAIRDLQDRLYGADPYCFCVLLKPYSVGTEEARQAVRRIVEADKPAHTCAGVQVLQPWIYLDMHTYLEINTYLSKPTPRLDTGAAIERDTLLSDTEAAGQIERNSRLALEITLT